MKPSFATPNDLAEWLGESIASESADYKRADRLLRMSSNLIRSYTGRDWTNPDNPQVLQENIPDELGDIACSAAGRLYVNPDARTSYNSQIDDALDGGSYKVDEAGIYLTASEKTTLSHLIAQESTTIGGLGVINTTRNEYASSDMAHHWFDDEGHDGFLTATVRGS